MTDPSVNLASLFGNVAQVLMENKGQLNSADTKNNDHGDNMVKVFNTITSALEKKSTAAPADQLSYASQQVEKECASGSGKVYAEGLARAASSMSGQSLNSNNAIQMITSLLGTSGSLPQSNAPTEGGDLSGMLGSLLGGGAQTSQSQNNSGDALSSLLGGLLGGGQSGAQSGKQGIGMDQVLAAGMEFMQSQQQGQDTMSSLLDAVLAGSQTGGGYRSQSNKLVASTLMQSLGSLLTKK